MPRPAGFRKRGAQAASGAYAQPVSPGLMILIAGGLLALAIGATLVAGRLRVPGLLLFLGLGMAVGGHGIGWIDLNNVRLARTIGVIALSLILFEGGLAAGFREVLARFGDCGRALLGLVRNHAAGLFTALRCVENGDYSAEDSASQKPRERIGAFVLCGHRFASLRAAYPAAP